MWGLEVRETQDLIELHRRLRELDGVAAGGFPDAVSPRALLAECGFDPQGDGPEIRANRSLLVRLLAALRPHLADRVTIEEAAPGGMRVPGLAAVLSFEGAGGVPATAPELLEAHLIAWHHGGSIGLEPCDRIARARLVLPVDPLGAILQEPDSTWIADQFSLLEP
jgi:hypothetical protein